MAVDHTADALATLVTVTTYGSWLRGDRRGWIDRDGRLREPSVRLEAADRRRMKHPPFRFEQDHLADIGEMIGRSLTTRLAVDVHALSIDTWHAHFVVGPTARGVGDVVKCAKDAVRYGLRPGRPIWTDGYDKRWCFDERSVVTRIRYVERRNERLGWGPRPWSFMRSVGPTEAQELAPGQ